MSRPVPRRGVIEGFYGTPWSMEARHDLLEFLAQHAMNTYVYAPKGDPKHRERWRVQYDARELNDFRELAARAQMLSIDLGFALAPGLDVDYRSDADRATLLSKLVPVLDVGIDWVVLALDDISTRPGLGREQADLAAWLLERLALDREVRLTVVPTEYVGTRPTPYLDELAAGLPATVDVMWTGPTVCSPTITAADARAWATALGGRRPLIWDNYPVNDGAMEGALHLGPYRGRDPELSEEVVGILCNPMLQPRASRIALATAAAYLADPGGYEPEAAWQRAIDDLGGRRAGALRAIAASCADGPLASPADLEVQHVIDALTDTTAAGWDTCAERAIAHFTMVKDAASAWEGASDRAEAALAGELAPWLQQGRREAKAALAALRLLQTTRAPEPDANDLLLHVFAVVFAWRAARAGDRTVFGPRFTIYPALVQLDGGQPALDVELAITEDANAVDRLCRLALDAYRRWADQQR